jgi:hypothetical protein
MPFVKEKNLLENMPIWGKLVPEKNIVKMALFCKSEEGNQ